ncbi:MAG: hypothetical protein RLZZ383_113 [Pseudomonadota bacterium]
MLAMAVVGVVGVVAIEALIGLQTWTGWGLALLVATPSVHVVTTALDPDDAGRPTGWASWALRYVAVIASLGSLLAYLGLAMLLVGLPTLAAVLLGLLGVVFAIGAVAGAAQVMGGVPLGMLIDGAGVREAAVAALGCTLMASTFGVFASRVWQRSDAWTSRFAEAYLATMSRLDP